VNSLLIVAGKNGKWTYLNILENLKVEEVLVTNALQNLKGE